MPLLGDEREAVEQTEPRPPPRPQRKQSQHSEIAKAAIMSATIPAQAADAAASHPAPLHPALPSHMASSNGFGKSSADTLRPLPPKHPVNHIADSATPLSTAPPSPRIPPRRQDSGSDKKSRPTTLDIPGLTKSRVSPDGKISQLDVGSKLVIVMVGLPARGKSYITKKMARYLNWLQHDTRIFNVGERRRVAAGGRHSHSASSQTQQSQLDAFKRVNASLNRANGILDHDSRDHASKLAAQILINGEQAIVEQTSPSGQGSSSTPPRMPELHLPDAGKDKKDDQGQPDEQMDQSASFFDPTNRKAALIREQCAIEALDELLDYIQNRGGSVGILDATNSTLERRKLIMSHIREKAGPDLNVLFMESLCLDENLLERNMRLKLSGPDYRGKDPEESLRDFKKRVEIYQKAYVPLGEYEERNNMAYVQMIDVGRKLISHQIKGFLSAQAVYYLTNFNLAPRQIWITRHGQSVDNLHGRIGGDSELSDSGRRFAQALSAFIINERKAWDVRQEERERHTHFPPLPGDHTPPNPHYECQQDHLTEQHFCVWTSMLKRSVQTGEYFDEDLFDIKQMRMLDELFSGHMEGMTYETIREKFPEEYERRRADKLLYRYPGPGGEGYLDVINRLRPVIVELERMTDHCLLIGHRSVSRVLLAYFMGLSRDKVTDLDVPLGVLYCLEPKPYGVDFKAFRFDPADNTFHFEPDYELRRATSHLD